MTSEGVQIPTIDIEPLMETSGKFYTEDDRAAAASALLRACETHGLFFVTGHGISAGERRTAFENARSFFSLPEPTKKDIPAQKGGFTRGYLGFGGESGSHLLECKEAFSYGFPWAETQPPCNALQGPNVWPDDPRVGEVWRENMISLFRRMVAVNEAVARGISISVDLGLPNLPELCRGGDTISLMRVFHYLPYSNDDDGDDADNSSGSSDHESRAIKGQDSVASGGTEGGDEGPREKKKCAGKIGSSPHTDWGLSTSIMQDGAGGLQFLERETQRWIDVPCAQEDALVFNCGDYLSLLSNGRLRSPVHQVVTTGVERTSFVFFYYPNFDSKLPAPPRSGMDRANPPGSSEEAAEDASASSTAAAAAAAGRARSESQPSVSGTSAVSGTVGGRTEGGAMVDAGAPEDAEAALEAARVGATAAVAKGVAAAGIGPYNTLLDLKRGDASGGTGGRGGGPAEGDADESFGQYLLRKWGAVFRE